MQQDKSSSQPADRPSGESPAEQLSKMSAREADELQQQQSHQQPHTQHPQGQLKHHREQQQQQQQQPHQQQAHNSRRRRRKELDEQRAVTMTLSRSRSWTCAALAVLALAVVAGVQLAHARTTFEKMTNRDYSGNTYYTIQNVSLFECLGWCKEDLQCVSAVFSFVVNPFAALQETTCSLQNETQARQLPQLRHLAAGDQATVVAHPQKAANLYFFNRIELPTEAVCARLWAFERFPNRRLRLRDRQPSMHAHSKEACQAACMNEQRFVCRSLEYNYITQQCTLSAYDRRSPLVLHLSLGSGNNNNGNGNTNNDLADSPGVDYFENACLLGEDICNESRVYDYAKIGLPLHRVAHFVELNYYPDKEMLVKSQAGCVRACTIEHEFICRSILYRSSFKQGQPNCALYHLDQRTFPDGAETFMAHGMQPLLDSGETSAVYLEAVCNDSLSSSSVQPTTITLAPSSLTIVPSATTPGGVSVHASNGQTLSPSASTLHIHSTGNGQAHAHLHTNHSNHSGHPSSPSSTGQPDNERFLSAASSTLSPLASHMQSLGSPSPSGGGATTTIRLPTTFLPHSSSGGPPSNIQIAGDPFGSSGRPMVSAPSHITIGPPTGSGGGGGGSKPGMPSHIMISPAPPTRDSDMPANLHISSSSGQPANHDQNCDAHGFCYDVALKCTDTKMIVNVKTQRPFFGRIYALGRSETCNANVKNQNQFQLDMQLTGQECNTQSAGGTYTNTIVLQHHNVVLTKADKVYHVRCTYETASRNVSFGMMPVKDMFEVDVNDRNQETISITASSDAPLPKISILTLDGKEASTVRIGDRLTFRIEIPDNTPYGIFARSCIAMAKDARSTFEIIDENGCPVDHTIFPNFLPVANGNALESNYEAFRFTESYGVIFQCNVKYCIGKCEPVNCGIGRDSVEAWGRKKRSIGGAKEKSASGKQLGDDMTLSREIVVLDLKEEDPSASADPDNLPGYSSAGGAQKSPLKSASGQHQASDSDSLIDNSTGGSANKHCLSSQSLFVLICSIGLFFVLYVCVVAYFFASRDPKISPIKHQYH